jgi:hypothetical protein
VTRQFDEEDQLPQSRVVYLLVELTNVSAQVLNLEDGHRTWAVYYGDGTEPLVDVCGGSFPNRIAPGAKAYVTDSAFYVLDDNPAPVARTVEIAIRPIVSGEPPTPLGFGNPAPSYSEMQRAGWRAHSMTDSSLRCRPLMSSIGTETACWNGSTSSWAPCGHWGGRWTPRRCCPMSSSPQGVRRFD